MIWAWLTTRIGKLVAGIALAMSILSGVFLYGRRTAHQDRRVKDLENYKDTREKIDEVDRSPDADAALDRLRRNGWFG